METQPRFDPRNLLLVLFLSLGSIHIGIDIWKELRRSDAPANCHCRPEANKLIHLDLADRLKRLEDEFGFVRDDLVNHDRRVKLLERRFGTKAGELPPGTPIGDQAKDK